LTPFQPSIRAGPQWRNWDERWEAANRKRAVNSPEDPEAPTTTPKPTPTPTPKPIPTSRPRGRWNRNKRRSINTSTRQHVNMSTCQCVYTATRQHRECSAGRGKAQKLAWEVWALGGVVSDGRAPPGARHQGRQRQRQRRLSWFSLLLGVLGTDYFST
jgi:hypothetical protein